MEFEKNWGFKDDEAAADNDDEDDEAKEVERKLDLLELAIFDDSSPMT